MQKVLITGINGSIGKKLADHLRSKQYEVYGTTRNKYKSEYFYLDLENVQEHTIRPEKYKAIIHCAAVTSEMNNSIDKSEKINVAGTKFLLELASEYQVDKFIYISSMSANANNPSNYGQTKLKVEQIIKSLSEINWVIFRPSLVLNKEGSGIFGKMFSYINKLPVIPVIGRNHKLSVIDVEDLCFIIEKSINSKLDHSKIVEVSSDQVYSLQKIVKLICKKEQRKSLVITIPYSIAIVVAYCLKFLAKPPITLDNVYGLKYSIKANTKQMESLYHFKAKSLEKYLESLK